MPISVVKSLQLPFLLGILLLLGGCATCTDCGALRPSREVTQLFRSNQIVPDYNYYYNGPSQVPRAIIGIDQRFQVEGRFWNPVDINEEQLSSWIHRVNTRPTGGSRGTVDSPFEGFEMLDSQGVRVGIWFSFFDWGVFKFPDENTINIFAPSFRPTTGSFSINNSRF